MIEIEKNHSEDAGGTDAAQPVSGKIVGTLFLKCQGCSFRDEVVIERSFPVRFDSPDQAGPTPRICPKCGGEFHAVGGQIVDALMDNLTRRIAAETENSFSFAAPLGEPWAWGKRLPALLRNPA